MGRAVVGTAVIAGTAGAVHHHQDKKWAKQDYEQQQQMEEEYDEEPMEEEQYAAPPPPAPAAAPGPDMADQLQQIAQLHESGVLTDEEFAAAKQKILDS